MQPNPGWLDHATATCPVPADTPTTIRLRNGAEITTKRPQDWIWGRAPTSSPGFANGGEIVAYRTTEQEAA